MNKPTKGRDMKSKKKIRAEIESLKEEKLNCVATVELELQGLANWLGAQFPGAPSRLLWAVAKYEPNVRWKVEWNRKGAAMVQRRIRRRIRQLEAMPKRARR